MPSTTTPNYMFPKGLDQRKTPLKVTVFEQTAIHILTPS